jgi:hypothetical protein
MQLLVPEKNQIKGLEGLWGRVYLKKRSPTNLCDAVFGICSFLRKNEMYERHVGGTGERD